MSLLQNSSNLTCRTSHLPLICFQLIYKWEKSLKNWNKWNKNLKDTVLNKDWIQEGETPLSVQNGPTKCNREAKPLRIHLKQPQHAQQSRRVNPQASQSHHCLCESLVRKEKILQCMPTFPLRLPEVSFRRQLKLQGWWGSNEGRDISKKAGVLRLNCTCLPSPCKQRNHSQDLKLIGTEWNRQSLLALPSHQEYSILN
jgi:hypothetical protein